MEVLIVHRKYKNTEKITTTQPTEKYTDTYRIQKCTGGAETQKYRNKKGGRDTENIEIHKGQRHRKYRNTEGEGTQKI